MVQNDEFILRPKPTDGRTLVEFKMANCLGCLFANDAKLELESSGCCKLSTPPQLAWKTNGEGFCLDRLTGYEGNLNRVR